MGCDFCGILTEEEYRNLNLHKDEEGIFTIIGGAKVYIMEEWERSYAERQVAEIIARYNPQSVLEIGYGMGITSKLWRASVKDYTVIEPNKWILATIPERVTVIKDFVQNVQLNRHFDLIYDDRFDLVYKDAPNWLKFDFDYIAFFDDGRNEIPEDIRPQLAANGFFFQWNGKECWQPVIPRNEVFKH